MLIPPTAAAGSVLSIAAFAGAAQLCTMVFRVEIVAKWPRIAAALRREAL